MSTSTPALAPLSRLLNGFRWFFHGGRIAWSLMLTSHLHLVSYVFKAGQRKLQSVPSLPDMTASGVQPVTDCFGRLTDSSLFLLQTELWYCDHH